MDTDHGDHSHGAGFELEPETRRILEKGLRELLALSEGMRFRGTGSERFPLPLAMAICGEVPEPAEVRELVESRLEADPVAALARRLVRLELYEGNQAGIEGFVPDDAAFLGMAFGTKRQNGWIGVLGEEEPAEVEEKINEPWKFKLVVGRERRTGLYSLLNMVVRYGFVYGKIGFGDAHAMGHFVEEFAPALLICRPGMDDLELTLSLAAMKLGVPAVVPEEYPFPLGRQARVDDLREVGAATAIFANIRRLMDFPEIPVLPEYLDTSHAGEKFEPALRWGATEESFYILRQGKVEEPGVEVIGEPGAAMGVVLTVEAEPMDAFDREYIEEKAIGTLGMMRGVRAQCEEGKLIVELAEEAAVEAEKIGEVLIATLQHEFPGIDRVRVELIFAREQLAGLAGGARQERAERSAAIAGVSEEEVESFAVCVGCSPFAPDHVCVLTPERPPQCNRSFQQIKAGALYGYDDMSSIHHRVLHAEVNSFGMAPKGEAIDAIAGEWSGINQAAARLTGGRTKRIQLHSLEEAPTTGCGCFQLVLFQMEEGIGAMQRGFKGKAPDGRTWEDLHYALAGKQTPGIAGAAPGYLHSAKFLAAHGGWKSVVWVSTKIAESMGEKLPEGVAVGTETE